MRSLARTEELMPANLQRLARRLHAKESSAVTDTMSKWHAAESTLTPIIGREAFVALYRRSLHLASADYPWLTAAEVEAGTPAALFACLGKALSGQPLAVAVVANDAVFACFVEQLTHLLGKALTERLLAPAIARKGDFRTAD
jgi:hypothetical protein